jgi:hypothetical protein
VPDLPVIARATDLVPCEGRDALVESITRLVADLFAPCLASPARDGADGFLRGGARMTPLECAAEILAPVFGNGGATAAGGRSGRVSPGPSTPHTTLPLRIVLLIDDMDRLAERDARHLCAALRQLASTSNANRHRRGGAGAGAGAGAGGGGTFRIIVTASAPVFLPFKAHEIELAALPAVDADGVGAQIAAAVGCEDWLASTPASSVLGTLAAGCFSHPTSNLQLAPRLDAEAVQFAALAAAIPELEVLCATPRLAAVAFELLRLRGNLGAAARRSRQREATAAAAASAAAASAAAASAAADGGGHNEDFDTDPVSSRLTDRSDFHLAASPYDPVRLHRSSLVPEVLRHALRPPGMRPDESEGLDTIIDALAVPVHRAYIKGQRLCTGAHIVTGPEREMWAAAVDRFHGRGRW